MSRSIPPAAVDPDRVPKKKLHNGAEMPAIGLGTFGSDHVSPQAVAEAVRDAIHTGYRMIDCAAVYRNEREIGQVLNQVTQHDGVSREELWITSKLWNDRHAPPDVIPACEQSLRDLQLDYLDLYLVHWPFPNFHPPHCDVSSRSPDAKPYIHENYMATWAQMEKLVSQGKVRTIGTSNMTIPKLERLLGDAVVKPACNEMELHPHFQQPEFFRYLRDNEIIPIGFCPIGSPARPERDRMPDDTSPTQDPAIVEIAAAHRIHPATLCVKWALQRGQVPIPFSTTPRNYTANLQASVSPPLSDADMTRIGRIDRRCRLIKGQVFLWKDGQDWRDLWDLDGTIAV
jgi:diketogulonate reductase-like aldo/keto reductase